jgi:hypothetical protein
VPTTVERLVVLCLLEPVGTTYTRRVSSLERFADSLKDPGAAAARGKWLARGAWLLAAAEVVLAVKDHLTDRLTPRERNRIIEIVRTSKGRPSNLSNRERKELQALLGKIEPGQLVKRVATTGFARRFSPGKRRS